MFFQKIFIGNTFLLLRCIFMEEFKIGQVVKYYHRLGVVVVDLIHELNAGDNVHFLGSTTDFEQQVQIMEMGNTPIKSASKGDSVGIKINERARRGDIVLKVIEDS